MDVGITKIQNGDLVEATQKLFDSTNVNEILKGKKKILIKPNFADCVRDLPRRDGDQTSTEVVEAIIKVLYERIAPEHIIVGEGSATPTWKAYFDYGMYDVAKKYKVRLVDFNNDDAVLSKIKSGYYIKELWIPRTLYEVDAIISVPVLKIWLISAISLSIKNYAGGVLPAYWYQKYRSLQGICGITAWGSCPQFNPDYENGQSKTLAAGMVDILLAAPKTTLSIIDGQTCMHLKTPDTEFAFNMKGMKTDRPNLLIGGENIVAVDSIGASVMGIDPQKILHLGMASEKGLGTNNMDRISVKGTALEDVRFRVTVAPAYRDILYDPQKYCEESTSNIGTKA